MRKAQFNELISYLQARPAEASRLVSALGLTHDGDRDTRELSMVGEVDAQPCTHLFSEPLVSAAVAGQAIRKSGKWVKEHREMFPSSRFEPRGQKGRWLFDLSEVKRNYNHYIISKTVR